MTTVIKLPDEFVYPTREQIIYYARKAGWEQQKDGGNKSVIIFNRNTEENGHEQMDVYWTTCTIKTSLKHPKKGKTQMFRRDVDLALYKQICKNPRFHTNKGYQRK